MPRWPVSASASAVGGGPIGCWGLARARREQKRTTRARKTNESMLCSAMQEEWCRNTL